MADSIEVIVGRLKEAKSHGENGTGWLEPYQQDLKQIIDEHGISGTAKLLNMPETTLYGYARRRGLITVEKRDPRLKKANRGPILEVTPNFKKDHQSVDYYRGKSEAYENILAQLGFMKR